VIEAVWDDGFKRRYKKRVKRSGELQRQFWKRMEVFLTDPERVLLIDIGSHDEVY